MEEQREESKWQRTKDNSAELGLLLGIAVFGTIIIISHETRHVCYHIASKKHVHPTEPDDYFLYGPSRI
jgi:hypothetical protein